MFRRINNYISQVDFERAYKLDKGRLTLFVGLEVMFVALILLIQEYMRPYNKVKSATLAKLMGILPSFFGAAAYVLIIFVMYKIIQTHYGRYDLKKALLISNCISFLGLTLWETMRMVIHNFDWLDVAATFAGCVMATVIIVASYAMEGSKKSLTHEVIE